MPRPPPPFDPQARRLPAAEDSGVRGCVGCSGPGCIGCVIPFGTMLVLAVSLLSWARSGSGVGPVPGAAPMVALQQVRRATGEPRS